MWEGGVMWWEGWRNVVGKGKLCARAFKHKKCIPEKRVFTAIGVWEGVRHVGGVEVCGTVLEMGQ